ncbi:hypothetical protein BC826DRAFT_707203 [Russula brevipes]|nr:hypothetical protein BC826DRAFT_707203 [Russula brevipes]
MLGTTKVHPSRPATQKYIVLGFGLLLSPQFTSVESLPCILRYWKFWLLDGTTIFRDSKVFAHQTQGKCDQASADLLVIPRPPNQNYAVRSLAT